MKKINNKTIRRAGESDLENVLTLFEQTIRSVCKANYTYDQIDVWVDSIQNRAKWLEKLNSQYFLLVEEGSELIGFGSIEKDGYLDFMYVHHAHQRKGIATLILKELLEYTSRYNLLIVYSNVSITARPFFESQGFKVVREQNDSRNGIELVNYRMEKIL